MNRYEQISVLCVGNCRPFLQGDEDVLFPCHDHMDTEFLLNQPSQTETHIQHDLLLHQTLFPDGPRVFAPMSGVYDNGAEHRNVRPPGGRGLFKNINDDSVR